MLHAAPGFVSREAFLFEVDPREIDDLTLEIWRSAVLVGYYQRVRVPLGISRGNAAERRSAAAGQVLRPRDSDTRAIP